MTDSDSNLPKEYKDGDSIPPADPEDIKRFYYVKPPWRAGNDIESACSPGADRVAVFRRWSMVTSLVTLKLLTPWKHGEELDDAVFKLAATFPLQHLKHKSYKITGDLLYPFDPNAFVQRLVEETGVAHTWEPVRMRLSEGGRCFSMVMQPGPVETAGKRQARELLWILWERCANDLVSHLGKERPEVIAKFYADFVIDNVDLVRQVEKSLGATGSPPMEVLQELEQRAARWSPWDR